MSKKAGIGLTKRRRGKVAEEARRGDFGAVEFLSLPVRRHCAPAVSIATAPLMKELLFTVQVKWMAAAASQRLLGV